MKNISHHDLLRILLTLMLVVGLAGCGDDDPTSPGPSYGTGLIGTWVTYNALDGGVPEPGGGTYGIGGTVVTINKDGTGASMDPEDIGTWDPFTWTQDGTTFNVTQGGSSWTMTAEVANNTLTITDVGDFVTIYQRYVGSGVLRGTWSIVSIVDDFAGGIQPVDPGDFSYRFNSDASVNYIVEGSVEDTTTYSTDDTVLTIGPANEPIEVSVFAVVGNTLYLFNFQEGSGMSEDQMFIMKFIKT